MTVSASPRLTTLYVCCSLHHFLADFSSLVDTLIYHTLICQRVWSLRLSSVSAVLLWTAISWSFGFKVLVPLSFSEINRCKMTNSIFAPFCKPHKMLPAFSNKSDHIMREVKLQQLVELKLHCIRQLVCYGHWHGFFFFSALSSFWGLPGNARWVLQLNMWHVCCHRCDISVSRTGCDAG